MARRTLKSRPTPFHTGFCRFTERRVEVFEHGHGIKLSIRTSDAEGDVVSVFLDAGDTNELAQALDGFRDPRASEQNNELRGVLMSLGTVLRRAGF